MAVEGEEELATLICGLTSQAIDLQDEGLVALVGLASLVRSYYRFILEYRAEIDSPRASYFMPVALRSLMEASAIALLCRIDPLRTVHSSKCQNSASYNKAQLQPSAITWRGDIVGDTKQPAAPGAPSKALWDPSVSGAKLPRQLLAEYMCDAFWIPAARNLANAKDLPTSDWIKELLSVAPSDLLKKLVGDGNQVYSELSKGIHPEFAVRREAEYDGPTLLTYLEKALKWTGSLGLLTHYAHSFSSRTSTKDAVAALLVIEKVAK